MNHFRIWNKTGFSKYGIKVEKIKEEADEFYYRKSKNLLMSKTIRSKTEGQMVRSRIYLLYENILNIETGLSTQKEKMKHPR